MKAKVLSSLIIALIPVFLWITTHKSAPGLPSDFRDAVADGAPEFDTTIPELNKTKADIPEPKAQKTGEFDIGLDADRIISAPAPKTVKNWTVMVFVNGKNNLEKAAWMDVNEMEDVGSTDKVNMVVEFGRMNGQLPVEDDFHGDGDWTGNRRYYITKDTDRKRITSPLLQDLGDVNMGNYQSAVDFARWTKLHFPAKRYLFIMWNHGGGWLSGISSDDRFKKSGAKNIIDAKEIGKVIRESGGADILAFDACLMQMAEVAYEVKDYTEVIVGSEETVPRQGFPYNISLNVLAKNPDISPETLGAVLVDAYAAYYAAMNDYRLEKTGKSRGGATLSAIRTSKLTEFAYRVREFAALARNSGDINALKLAKKHSTRYGAFGPAEKLYIKTPYVDFYDFVDIFSSRLDPDTPKADIIRQKAGEIKEFISKSLIINNAAMGKDPLGFPLTSSHGISIYLPPRSPSMTRTEIEDYKANIPYGDTEFNRYTDWLDFVIFMYTIELNEGRDLPPLSDHIQFT